MKTPETLRSTLKQTVWRKRDRLVDITRQLIQTPSENTPPLGNELACQSWLAGELRKLGLETDLYSLDEVAGLKEHPLFQAGRDYRNRPNLAAFRRGSGNGRSLLLSGHIDTVPRGSTQDWTRSPFSAHVDGQRIYGRGANDMKGGIATNLFIMECLSELDLALEGDLTFESVVDEEFGGSNGTLAGRLHGYSADGAILSEPSSLRICPAQRGGRTVHLTFRAAGGVLQDGKFPAGVIPQLTHFLNCLPSFAQQRKAEYRVHPMYAQSSDPVPVSVTKVFTAPWGFGEPITTPEKLQLEVYWQLMPGETQETVEAEFMKWLQATIENAPDVYPAIPEVTFPIRWMPGSSLPGDHSLIRELASCVASVTGSDPTVAGIEGPCDLFIFQQGFEIPAVIWGPRGGNTHAADEYVEIDSLVTAAMSLLLFVAEWCGIAHR